MVKQPNTLKRILRLTIGSALLVLGVAGLVLPFLQGFLFLGLGAMMLAPDLKIFSQMEQRIASRFPRVGNAMIRMRKSLPLMSPDACIKSSDTPPPTC